ncbi:LysR family transcriptional regulator [Brevibacillus laterosporus]|nr:LysR family transcriptional regulator [Brevibacillus laterosporus]
MVDLGRLTKAGEVLNLTQSAIRNAISSLEYELGLHLLIRNRPVRICMYRALIRRQPPHSALGYSNVSNRGKGRTAG